ncbi:MAG: S-adenosylmethionine:tRNA ribosyltransferase-isomerase [Saprospiraceae bacterium]
MILTKLDKQIDFQLPRQLACALPTEERKIGRDGVRLLVSERETDDIQHARFRDIGQCLRQGDVLVVNTSATMPAALDIELPDGGAGRMHLSTQKDDHTWIVEIRAVLENKTHRYGGVEVGQKFDLPDGGYVKIKRPFYKNRLPENHLHLWEASFRLPHGMNAFLEKHGKPIRYDQLQANYPLAYYQTIFSNEMGSSEMPSAGRAFTPALVAELIVKGVQFAPIVLHTGVSSLESNERPYPEFYKMPPTTASLLNLAKKENRRIIAVGTTAVRAVESATDTEGIIRAGNGWTDLYITPDRGMHTVTGLLTGFHEPKASHLLMLGALAEATHLQKCYDEALVERYEWHEFGDLHLLL